MATRLRVDLTGQQLGRWTVLRFAGRKRHRALFECVCECGTKRVVRGDQLKSGASRSCGCLNREIVIARGNSYGLSETPLYAVWSTMMARCYNPDNISYPNYGGRGIRVCSSWHDVRNFFNDMEASYKRGLLLERKDNDGYYSPDNCRWATRHEQVRNTRQNRWVKIDGIHMTITDAARKYGVPIGTVYRRLELGWDLERALKDRSDARFTKRVVMRPTPDAADIFAQTLDDSKEGV